MPAPARPPRQAYGGKSYMDVVLYPIAAAIKAAIAPTSTVDLIMQGEMGVSSAPAESALDC